MLFASQNREAKATAQGRIIRRYFIECERKLQTSNALWKIKVSRGLEIK